MRRRIPRRAQIAGHNCFLYYRAFVLSDVDVVPARAELLAAEHLGPGYLDYQDYRGTDQAQGVELGEYGPRVVERPRLVLVIEPPDSLQGLIFQHRCKHAGYGLRTGQCRWSRRASRRATSSASAEGEAAAATPSAATSARISGSDNRRRWWRRRRRWWRGWVLSPNPPNGVGRAVEQGITGMGKGPSRRIWGGRSQ